MKANSVQLCTTYVFTHAHGSLLIQVLAFYASFRNYGGGWPVYLCWCLVIDSCCRIAAGKGSSLNLMPSVTLDTVITDRA